MMVPTSKLSRTNLEQHFAPAQHCRCGMAAAGGCNVQFTIYKLEEHPPEEVLAALMPGPWLLPRDARANRALAARGGPASFLTPATLAWLNEATKFEQEALGYAPYEVDWAATAARPRRRDHG